MSKKHDENKDLRIISRIAKVSYYDKTIQASKSANIGIRTLGRLDYLCKYCGWTFIFNNSVILNSGYNSNYENITNKREAKKAIRENSLTNKKRR